MTALPGLESATASDRYAWYLIGPGWAGVHRRLHALPPPAPSPQLTLGGVP